MALNQKTRSLLTLAGLAAATAGAALFAYYGVYEKQARQQEQQQQQEKLFAFEPGKVTGLTVFAKGETTRLARAKEGGGWGIISPLTAPADDAAVSGILERLASMKRKSVVEEKSADLSKYGLQRPAIKLVVQLEDGSERVLRAGSELKFDGSSYVALDDSSDVLQAEGGFRWELEKSTFELREKSLAPFDEAQVTALDFQLGPNRFVLRKDGETWRLQSPVSDLADEATVNRLLGALRGLRAIGFQTDLANPAEDQAHGLDRPSFQAVLTLARGERMTLVASQLEAEDGTRKTYARRRETTTIAEIAESSLREFGVQEFDLRSKQVLAFEREKVARVVLELGGETLTLERAPDADAGLGQEWSIVAPTRAPARQWKMSGLLWALGSLRASGFASESAADLAPFGLDRPARTVRLFGEDGRELASLLVGREEGDKLFVKNSASPRVFEVGAESLKDLPRARADLEEQPKADGGAE